MITRISTIKYLTRNGLKNLSKTGQKFPTGGALVQKLKENSHSFLSTLTPERSFLVEIDLGSVKNFIFKIKVSNSSILEEWLIKSNLTSCS